MLPALLIMTCCLVVLWFGAKEFQPRRRVNRRRVRRSRRVAYQRIWDALMRRDPVKRLPHYREDA